MRRTIALLCVLFFFEANAQALPFRSGRVIMPPGTLLTLPNGATVKKHPTREEWILYVPPQTTFPFVIKARGPMGGFVERVINSPADLDPLLIEAAVIKDKNPNPEALSTLPLLCPQLKVLPSGQYEYDARFDRLNHQPIFQLLDPDANQGEQYKSFSEMDGKNVLKIQKITVRNDYEDNRILDYSGPHPVTGAPHEVYEGNGGFYANIHYAVVPYSRAILKMERQLLLHLAQGKLSELNAESSRPALRTHSFLPGPFISRTGSLYDLCEWGDTAYQAPEQTILYRDLAVWDWDYSVRRANRVLLIIWEGDEEDWMIHEKMIDPFYLTDDLIGIFEIRRDQTLIPLLLKSRSGDFEVTVVTGDLEVKPR